MNNRIFQGTMSVNWAIPVWFLLQQRECGRGYARQRRYEIPQTPEPAIPLNLVLQVTYEVVDIGTTHLRRFTWTGYDASQRNCTLTTLSAISSHR